MSIAQILAQNILIFYGLLGLSTIWLAYEIKETLKQRRKTTPIEETGWTTPSPEQAWKQTQPKPSTIAVSPPIKSTPDADPLKQFFQKENVSEPVLKPIKATKTHSEA